MFGKPASQEPQDLWFFLAPSFSMMAFASAVEPLRAANRMAGRTLYTWRTLTASGSPAVASNGLHVLPDGSPLTPAPIPAAIFVCAGMGVENYRERPVFAWLRRMAGQGTPIGGLCTGPLILARAGLLDGYRCTLHWETVEPFVEEFPDLAVTATLFEIDRDRFTCSGGTAALDMMLHLIALDHSRDLAMQAAEVLMHTLLRPADDPQRMALRYRTNIRDAKVLAAIAAMESHLELPLTTEAIAAHVKLSPRQLERLFQSRLGTTPSRYYQDLRLKRARQLLGQTSMSVTEVAHACGFCSASHFARSYRARFGRAPRAERPDQSAPR
ncbi:transcriptional regulator, AraC family [Caenispirillum salinarum AK4]|uniref:Transcriptional regulator, AraC family n=1 Tax=Caenispirillum salinarum AK4 TaxID=1238182 RepID=K9GQL9_9PROT|nr:GlxA family transcriptional regulator [Caenispirillum salinarum]EKV27029.1 transcriptional regulator, AraC family [Caenispirillum salinarum AK4]